MIGFRVDANETIATGHLMRCIAMAKACVKLGEECVFFLAEEKETERLEKAGLLYRILYTDWRDMEAEEEKLKLLLLEEKVDWLVVDSYQVTVSYLEHMEQFVRILYVDDMEQAVYPVSALLRYALWPEDMHYQEMYQGMQTSILAGMQYVPLREEFSKEQNDGIREKSILITTGGTDTYNVAGKLLESCLHRKELDAYVFHVIVGSMNQFEQELRKKAEDSERVFLHKNVTNMSDYMRQCELAVSAGGSTLFELCACKIPTICFSFADNQVRFANEIGERDIMVYAGDARERQKLADEIVERLCEFSQDAAMRKQYAEKMSALVDGKGTKRIADFLTCRQ